MNRKNLPKIGTAKYLTLYFEGYFTCRIATDPDPTNEERGTSGYTMALVDEDKLDQVIRLQVSDDFIEKNCRPPMGSMGLLGKLKQGVYVNSITFDGKPLDAKQSAIADYLLGAKVNLKGRDEPFEGPTFESRNNITGSDDMMSFVIDPFCLHIGPEKVEIEGADESKTLEIKAEDILNPAEPDEKIWQIQDPNIYGRRLSKTVEGDSQEVQEAINVFDDYNYFYTRRSFLQREIDRLQSQRCPSQDDKMKVQQFKLRLYQLEFWGDRVINKLATKVSWDFQINGSKELSVEIPCGTVDKEQPWPFKIWFGGWDGDLLLGYTRGQLSIPFKPN